MIAPSMRHLPSVSFCHPVVIEQRNVFRATDAKALCALCIQILCERCIKNLCVRCVKLVFVP